MRIHRQQTARPAAVNPSSADAASIQIPLFDVRDHLAAGDLVEVLPDARAEPLPVHLVYAHRRNLSRRTQAFAAWLQELLAPALDGT